MNAVAEQPTRGACASGGGSANAGLVPSKTTAKLSTINVNLSRPECTLRRIKRLKRSVWASGHLHALADNGFRSPVCWFVTLTYRGVNDWQPEHIKRSLDAFRRWCKGLGIPCRYTWVAELQKRGAVHYHLLCWLPKGITMPQWDRTTAKRDAFWSHGMTNTQKSFAGVGYLMKYLSKLGELHTFPKGLRLYGIGGLNQTGRQMRQWYNLPEWVKNEYGVGEVVRRKVGLMVQATGEILSSPYRVSLVCGQLIVQLIGTVQPRQHGGAYSRLNHA